MFFQRFFHNRLGMAPVLALVAGVTALGAAAHAQEARKVLKEACADDYKKLCGSVTPGGGRIKQCMQDNAAKLSERCRTALLDAKAAKEAAAAQKKP